MAKSNSSQNANARDINDDRIPQEKPRVMETAIVSPAGRTVTLYSDGQQKTTTPSINIEDMY